MEYRSRCGFGYLPLIIWIFSLLGNATFGEGSKELYIGSDNVYLFSCNDVVGQCNNGGPRTRFASYGCPENDRLYFVKLNLTETIYLGFHGSVTVPNSGGIDIVFRIKNLAGTVVYPTNGTEMVLPSSGTGYITNIGNARVGPTQIYGVGGYTAINFHPADTGTFYIEWTRKTALGLVDLGGISMELLDITVYDTIANLVKPGRLYSKSWQFWEESGCSSTTFVYSVDSIITSCQFSNMGGGIWVQFCNQWGCENTGNFEQDRKSKNSQSLLPQFKIFVNNPDPELFVPAVTLGQIVPPDPYGVQDCNTGYITFFVNVDKPGNVAIELSFGGGYVTRTISDDVEVGENTIIWDGRDGALPTGVLVPNDVDVTFTVQYINGLTNLPFYDVETNTAGFTIDMVNPPAPEPPFVFWDDSGVSGGSNLTGCQSPPGCHSWNSNFGNLKTINTWWYNISETTVPITIAEWREPGDLVFNQSPPLTYCAGTSGVVFSVNSDDNTTEYNWGFTGTGATITQNLPSDPFITVNFADATTGNITVYGTNSNCGDPSAVVTLPVTINPIPTVDAVSNQVVCNGAATTAITFSGTAPGATYNWTNTNTSIGLPAIGNGNIASFSALNSTASPVTAMISVTPSYTYGGVTCTGASTSFTITVNPTPTVDAEADQVVCNGSTTAAISFSGFVPGTVYEWTNDNININLAASGSGDISSFTATNTTNVPITATITTTPQFTNSTVTCYGNPQSFTITVNPTPTVDAVTNQTVCQQTSTAEVNFSGFVPGTVYDWVNSNTTIGLGASGFGTIPAFTATNTTLAPITGTITITPSFSNGGTTCPGSPTNFTITVNPKPDLLFPATPANPQEICSGTASQPVPLSSSVTVPGVSYAWTAEAFDPVLPTSLITGFTTPSPPNPAAIPADNITSLLLTQGVVKYTVTPYFNSPGLACPGDPLIYQTLVNPSPSVALDPADPTGQTICSGESTVPITFTPNATPVIYTWEPVESININETPLSGTTDNIPAQTLSLTGLVQGHVKYKVTPSYQGGGTFVCPGGVSYSTIFVNPLPTPVISGAILTCELGPEVTYSTPHVDGNSYAWVVAGGTIASGAGTHQITIQWGSYTASPGTITLTETINATGCLVTTPTYQVTLQQRPIPTLAGPTEVCTGSTLNVYNSDAGNFNYTWTINGGTFTGGSTSTSPSATVTWDAAGTNWIEVNYQNALGCPGFPAKRINVLVNPLPVTTITQGAGPDCNGQSHTYQTPLDLACTYTWSATPGVVAGGQSTNNASINWLAAGPATVAVTGTYIGTTGCTSSSTFPTTVYPSPLTTLTSCFDLVTTQNAKPFELKGGLPVGGEFQGSPAISYDIITGKYWFNPASALVAPGVYPITYLSQNSYGCANTSSEVRITLLPSNATFMCNTPFNDPRDGKSYATVMLGSQCWFRENLRYSAPSPYFSTPLSTPQSDNCTFERYCLTADPTCTTYGGFYQWNELMQYNDDLSATRQGFCPPGWHVPSATEWQNMIDASQGPGVAGGELKDLSATQSFRAILGGIAYLNNIWAFTTADAPNASLYWTSTLTGNKPTARGLNSFNPSVSIYEGSPANAFPVRCVKDN